MELNKRCVIFFGLLTAPVGFGQVVSEMPDQWVLANRLNLSDMITRSWSEQDISAMSPRTIDELLSKDTSFSLYRRQSAMFANPTAAGLSLRNTGASGASRSLVLLDGIPQNDPFGGWVYWAKILPSSLGSMQIVPASRSIAWGSQAVAGTVQMNRIDPFENRTAILMAGGSQQTLSASVLHQAANRDQTQSISISAFGMESEGFYNLTEKQRGPLDRTLDLHLSGTEIRHVYRSDPSLSLESTLSYYQESRGNGTPLAGNASEAIDFSLRLTRDFGESSWQALAWHQLREFEATFTNVNNDRTAETIALDQYDVPATGSGASFVWQGKLSNMLALQAGIDGRFLDGTTHEQVGIFRNRQAGGQQGMAGIYTAFHYEISENHRWDVSMRMDAWRLMNGMRKENSLSTGQLLLEQNQNDRSGFEPTVAISYEHLLNDTLLTSISLSKGFRLPTLNELHRPFRVRNAIVEANPDLTPEQFIHLENEWSWQFAKSSSLSITGFHHWIDDAIANVPQAPPTAAGSLSKRDHVDHARVYGVQADLDWSLEETLRFQLSAVLSKTRFTQASKQPLLEDKPFAQAPELRLSAELNWRANEGIEFFCGGDYSSDQFDDALAEQLIEGGTQMYFGARARWNDLVYQIRVDNALDEVVETGNSPEGLRSIGPPRRLWASVEWKF